jgi:hypothetical protein
VLADCRGGCGLRVPALVAICTGCRDACPTDLQDWYLQSRRSFWPYARWAAEDAMRAWLRANPPAVPARLAGVAS